MSDITVIEIGRPVEESHLKSSDHAKIPTIQNDISDQGRLPVIKTLANPYTVKALLSPWGPYLISDTPEAGLIREGSLFKKLDKKIIYMIALSVFYLIFGGFTMQFYDSNT